MFLEILGWVVLMVIAFCTGGISGMLFCFEGFMGFSSGWLRWIFIVISLLFFILSFIYFPFLIVVA